jgi:hypothetical protein
MADFRIYKREKKSNKNKKAYFFFFFLPSPILELCPLGNSANVKEGGKLQ